MKPSVMRISSESVNPPKNPADAPIRVPIRIATNAAQMPTAIEMRPPQRMRARMSWPLLSVPSQNSEFGEMFLSGIEMWLYSRQ